MQLSEAGNTYNIALYEIEKRSYEILTQYNEDTEFLDWIAKKDDITIHATSPLTLLALVVIADEHGETWQDIATGNILDRILSKD